MSGPYVYIGTYTIKSGRQDEARERCGKLVELVQEKEPRLISFNIYLDDEATQMSVVQVHPDAESMEWHLEVVAEHIATSFESFLGSTVYEHTFGRPTESLTRTLLQWADPGASATSMPDHVAGFTRSSVPSPASASSP
jgi:hypothetical protein